MDYLNLDDYDTPERVAKLGEIDLEFAKLLLTNSPDPLNLDDIPALRASISAHENALTSALPPLPPHVHQTTLSIPLRNSSSLPAILVHNSTPSSSVPLIVLYHGCGYVASSPTQLLPYAHGLAKLFPCAILLPSYRLAPEHFFPTGVLDARDALKFSSDARNLVKYGVHVDHSKGFIVGGLSTGADFAAVLARKARDEALEPRLTGQYLSTPLLVSGWNVPEKYRSLWFSALQHKEAPLLSQADRERFEEIAKVDPREKLASPLNGFHEVKTGRKGRNNTDGGLLSPPMSPVETFLRDEEDEDEVGEGLDDEESEGELPRAFMQVCGMDPTRDDGLVYARMLRDCGVDSRVVCYEGLPHGWWMAYPSLEASVAACGDIARGIAWLLGLKNGDWGDGNAEKVMALPTQI